MPDLLRYFKAYLRMKFNGEIPLKVSHHLVYRCNLDCGFCERRNKEVEELSTDEVKDVMDEFYEMGTLFWSFNGGESLLRDDIGEIIDYGKKLGFYCSLVTNGTLVLDKIDEIENLDHVQISLDGYGDTHDSIRGEGTFEEVSEAVDKLKERDVSVQIMTVLNKENVQISEIERLVDWVDRKDIGINFQPVYVQPEDSEESSVDFYPTEEEMEGAVDRIIELKDEGKPINSSFQYLEGIGDAWPDSCMQRCWAGKISCNITPEGFVSPCCEKLPEGTDELSVVEGSARESFSSIPDMSQCSDCYSNFEMETSILMSGRPWSLFSVLRNVVSGKWIWS